jgi:tetratricopeptide (TPR) repeat protein
MKQILSFLLLFLLLNNLMVAQSGANEILYQKGMKAREEYKYYEGLALFQILLKSDSTNVDYLAQTSYFLARVGQLQPTKDQRMNYYYKAEYIAEKAVVAGHNNAEAHYSYALALGRINEHASHKQMISNAKLMKSELDTCLEINPKHDFAWHVLGRWHREIAGLNGIERFMVNALYGGMPVGGTYVDAITSFQNAIKYNPKYIIHYFELAKTFYLRDCKGDKEFAKEYLKAALSLPDMAPDDPENRQHCEELLKKLE